MPSLPSSLALGTIADGSAMIAADERNNFTAIQTAVNALITALSGGTSGQTLQAASSTSVNWITVAAPGTPAFVTWHPANPAGTTSGTQVMMGMGTTMTFTPALTGRLLLAITGKITNSGSSSGTPHSNIRYGTGSAPANGAAASGTQAGPDLGGFGGTALWFYVVTGLTLSTAYWLDIALATNNPGVSTSTLTDVLGLALEL